MTRIAPTLAPMIVKSRCLRAWAALRSSCRSSFRLAVSRRCSLVGTAAVLLVVIAFVTRTPPGGDVAHSRHRVCQERLSVGAATHGNARWETGRCVDQGVSSGRVAVQLLCAGPA